MKNRYSLDELEKAFTQHAIIANKNNEELITQWRENSPGEPLPEYFKDDLSLPLALLSIISEIKALRHEEK